LWSLISPDGRYVYVTNYNSSDLSVIDIATNTVTDIVKVGEKPVGVAVSPDGTKIYVTNTDSTVSVIDSSIKRL
jgi:YVTN family beta-propeller protein